MDRVNDQTLFVTAEKDRASEGGGLGKMVPFEKCNAMPLFHIYRWPIIQNLVPHQKMQGQTPINSHKSPCKLHLGQFTVQSDNS